MTHVGPLWHLPNDCTLRLILPAEHAPSSIDYAPKKIVGDMMRWLKFALGLGLIILAALFLAFWVTFLLMPLWRWIEADFGIEVIGHSGPAEWCFYLVFAILVAPALYFFSRVWRSGRSA